MLKSAGHDDEIIEAIDKKSGRVDSFKLRPKFHLFVTVEHRDHWGSGALHQCGDQVLSFCTDTQNIVHLYSIKHVSITTLSCLGSSLHPCAILSWVRLLEHFIDFLQRQTLRLYDKEIDDYHFKEVPNSEYHIDCSRGLVSLQMRISRRHAFPRYSLQSNREAVITL